MNAAQKIFVEEMIKHGNEENAVLKAYPHLKGNKKQIRNYCGRLMKNDEVSASIHQRAKEIQDLATDKAVEELKDKIVADTLDANEKRNLLAQIARGEMRIQEHYFDREAGAMESYYREPDAQERIKAIDIHNKMIGDYAPTEINNTGSIVWHEVKTYDTNKKTNDSA